MAHKDVRHQFQWLEDDVRRAVSVRRLQLMLEAVAEPLRFAQAAEIERVIGCGPGSLGPRGLPFTVIADTAAAALAHFVCGANVEGRHLTGVNWGRDIDEPVVADLRNAQIGDPSPDGQGCIDIKRGIEVGHIFQLGTKYSEAMKANVLEESGRSVTMTMGCYGIGVSRIVAAAIEQNHDDAGIIWPDAIAPINMHKSERLREAAEALYRALLDAGVDVLLHDGRERPGVMFADIELIGIPHRIVLSDRGLDAGTFEYKARDGSLEDEPRLDDAVSFIHGRLRR